METPLVVTLARQLSARDQMSVISNNIANMSTNGYKAERLLFRDYFARTAGGDAVVFPERAGLHRMTNAGPIEQTSNPLDLALRGDGYFMIETPAGTRFTRNGHFALDDKGQLVNSQGHPVMAVGNRPIVFDQGTKDIMIAEDGTVSGDEKQVGKLRLVRFANPQQLERQGGTLFKTDQEPLDASNAQVVQGHLEGANVTPVLEITRFMTVTGVYQTAKKLIDSEDERLRRAIQVLGAMPN